MENQRPRRRGELTLVAVVVVLFVGFVSWYASAGDDSDHRPANSRYAPSATASVPEPTYSATPVTTGTTTVVETVDPATLGPAKAVTSREWQLIAKDPASHVGEHITIVGTVAQFDTVTGPGMFLAEVTSTSRTGNAVATMCAGDPTKLANLVAGDSFRADAMVDGTVSYTTTTGGRTVVPKLIVTTLK